MNHILLNIQENLWFLTLYPVIVNLATVILGAFLLFYGLKPNIVISDNLIFNNTIYPDRFHYKFYNKSRFISIVDVKTSLQIFYIDKNFSNINSTNLIKDQGPVNKVERRKLDRIKVGNYVFYGSGNSAWVRGVPLNSVANKIKEINTFGERPEIKLVLKISYKSGLTNLQHSKTKEYRLGHKDGLNESDDLNDIKQYIATIMVRGYFKKGVSVEIMGEDKTKERNLEIEVQKKYREGGYSYAKEFITNKLTHTNYLSNP